MLSDPDLRGVWVPLITPFTPDDQVDTASIVRLCNEYLDAGAKGIVALGTTGESPALDATEKRVVVDTCAAVCASRNAPLMVGTGTNNTRTTIAATEALAGVPAVNSALVVVPYYVRPSEAAIVEHYKAVAAASPVPIVLYNIPARTGRGLGVRSLLELAEVDNIIGVKQATGALDDDTIELLASRPADFHVLSGDDPFLLPIVLLGGSGGIAASAHVCTDRFVTMVDCGLNGKTEDGRHHHDLLVPVVRAGFAEPNPSVWKGVLHAQGRIATPDVRMPMSNASAGSVDRCLAAIAAAT